MKCEFDKFNGQHSLGTNTSFLKKNSGYSHTMKLTLYDTVKIYKLCLYYYTKYHFNIQKKTL